jgi:hypothetical protein
MLEQGNAPKFDAGIYGKIALNDLVTYAVYYLTQIGEEITAEDIVAACFLMFPQRFSLRGYNQWPDSTVVNKRWVATRAVINTSPEPVSNIVVSLAEDVLVVVSILLAVFLPVVIFFVIAAGVAVSVWLLPKVIRFFRQVFRRIRRLFRPATA